ncbi:MAG: C39 family peptidase [Dehalococcoidia bacterium]|nr:C39 family peptidase [Dehalococcoidia bacterium]
MKRFFFVVVLVIILVALPLLGLIDTVISSDDTAPLSTAITDLAGNPLAALCTWSLTAELALSQSSEGLLDVTFFSQKDPAWSGDYLDHSRFNIGNNGCPVTSLAMVADYFGYDTDPGRLNTSLTAAGGIDAEGIICDWSKVEEASNEKVKWIGSVPASWNRIEQELNEGYPVICSVTRPGWMLYLHFIVFIGKVGNKYYFLDPLDEAKSIREWPEGKYEYAIDANQRLEICRPNRPPICAIELQKQGGIANVDIGEVFYIHTGNSTDDFGLTKVRFSSDDSQDATPTGEWTEWYEWDISSGDWDAVSKTKAWSFATGGNKEVWAEIKDDGSNVAQGHADISVHPGYAVIVAGEGGWREKWSFNHAANNAYRSLRNLGFGDSHIYYLNSDRPQDIDGDEYHDDEVDMTASFANFRSVVNEISDKIGDRSALFVLYLVGHGVEEAFSFSGDSLHVSALHNALGDGLLDGFSEKVKMLIVIESCYSGSFINASATSGEDSISAENRIIITAAHDDQERLYEDILRSSDRFWGNLNQGLDIKEAFVKDSSLGGNFVWRGHEMWFGDEECSLLDDNGDRTGNPPYHLDKDGELAAATKVGGPGTQSLELTNWYLVWKHSLGELRVYDSENRVTGLVNGHVKEEIPDSIYNEETEIAAISSPSSSYRYEVTGTGKGTYGLDIACIEGSEGINFTAIDIPTALGTVHEYTIDWDALARGEDGVIVQVDSDGDGTTDYALTAGNVLTGDEFMPQSGCFIATAAYGTPMAQEIEILREFRDKYLLTNPPGQALVNLYYRVSPPMAEFITEHPSLKPIVRLGLLPAVVLSTVAVNTTLAEKTAIVGLLVLVSVELAVWATRRRGRGPEYNQG